MAASEVTEWQFVAVLFPPSLRAVMPFLPMYVEIRSYRCCQEFCDMQLTIHHAKHEAVEANARQESWAVRRLFQGCGRCKSEGVCWSVLNSGERNLRRFLPDSNDKPSCGKPCTWPASSGSGAMRTGLHELGILYFSLGSL